MQVRFFGLLLAILVVVNFVLAITWLPVAVVTWERHLSCCSAVCTCCEERRGADTVTSYQSAHPPIESTSSLERPFSLQPARTDAYLSAKMRSDSFQTASSSAELTGPHAGAPPRQRSNLSELLLGALGGGRGGATPRGGDATARSKGRSDGGPYSVEGTPRSARISTIPDVPPEMQQHSSHMHATTALLYGIPIKAEAEARSGRCSYLNSRFIWRHIFKVVHFLRFLLVAGLLGASVYGGILASRLEPANALPKLFDDSNNVQQFINLWASNFTDSSVYGCSSCMANSVDMGTIGGDMASDNDATTGGGGSSSGAGRRLQDSSSAAMAAAFGSDLPPGAMQDFLPPGTPLADANALALMPVNRTVLNAPRVNENTIPVFLMWGVAGVSGGDDDGSKVTDSFAVDASVKLDFDRSFDLSQPEQQRTVIQQVCLHS